MKVSLGIPYWGADTLRGMCLSYCLPKMQGMREWDRVEFRIPPESQTRGGARNHLVRTLSDSDVVVVCDADSFVELDGLNEAIEDCYQHGGLHYPYHPYRYLTAEGTQALLQGAPVEALSVGLEVVGGMGGCMVMRPEQWAEAGWMIEMQGWGFEDVIFGVQTRSLLDKDNQWHSGWLTSLFHRNECHVGSDDYNRNIAVCKRYEAASGDKEKIRALIAERDSS
jgi:hypothetical protein